MGFDRLCACEREREMRLLRTPGVLTRFVPAQLLEQQDYFPFAELIL